MLWVAGFVGGVLTTGFVGMRIALWIKDRRRKKAGNYLDQMEINMVSANLAKDPKKINKRHEQFLKDNIQ